MKINWKRVALYVLRVIELIVSGAAGGAMTQLLLRGMAAMPFPLKELGVLSFEF